MKITISKKFVESYQLDRVKADAKEFKGRYTDGDLLRSFMDQTNDYRCHAGNIVYCNVEAMDAGWYYGEKTHFVVEMLVEGFKKLYKLRFYVNMNLEVCLDPLLIQVREFKEV